MGTLGGAFRLLSPKPQPGFWLKHRSSIAKALHLDLTHGQEHYVAALNESLHPGDRWLDIGCGRQIVPSFAMPLDRQRAMLSRAALLVGLDADPAICEHPLLHSKVMGRGETLPFADESFDLVSANVVVEHVEFPDRFLREVYRILRPGGRFLFHTPNRVFYLTRLASLVPDRIKKSIVWLLERRHSEDVFPTHYRMNTVKEVRWLAETGGFELQTLRVVGSVGSFGFLGPLGWLECLVLKLAASVGGGRFNSNLIVALRRPAG
jgi:ubiquinone/menaquinone biosynthesis C-methylase UbiE